ncbi:MAG: histone-like nucleoid-structuring protein Lsr2 [Actinomycetales bacterium]
MALRDRLKVGRTRDHRPTNPDRRWLSVNDSDARTSETVTFGIDGRDYEIDLSKQDAERLRATIAPYISAARRVGGRALHVVRQRLADDMARSGNVRQ